MRMILAILVMFGAAVLLMRRTAVPLSPTAPTALPQPQATAATIQDRRGVVESAGMEQPEFERLIRQDPGVDRANAMIRLAGNWAKENPRLALESFLAQTSGTERSRGAAQTLGVWAKADPLAAKAWLESASLDSSIAPLLRAKLYSSWAENDPRSAIEDAIGSGAAGEANTVFGIWGAQDLDAAVAFHEKLPPELQKETRATLLLTAAAQKSEWADALFEEFLLETSEALELIRVGKALSSSHPELAALVVDHLPEGPETEAYRRKLSFITAGANVQEAGIPEAPRRLIRAAESEPSNSLP